MKNKSQWDKLSRMFNTYVKGKINPCVADNIVIAWPVFFKIIAGHKNSGKRLLDYGCGTGGLCNILYKEGFKVVGVDISKKMITAARRNSCAAIKYYIGNKTVLNRLKDKFDIIASVMTFQFIADFETYAPVFFKLLNGGGLLVFAVFNPDFVKRLRRDNIAFGELKPIGKNLVSKLQLRKGLSINTYIRKAQDYRKILEQHGFKFITLCYPPFTKKFVSKYAWKLPWDVPEFLIMAFQRPES